MTSKLRTAEVMQLVDLVLPAFLTVDLFRDALPNGLKSWAKENLSDLMSKRDLVETVVIFANDNERVDELIRALYLHTANRGLMDFIEGQGWFVTEVRQRLADATRELLPSDNPLIDRDYLRERVREFLDPTRSSRRVLVIPPSASPGKTYSENLLRHVASALDLNYVLIDCLRIRCHIEVARIIANRLAWDEKLPELERQMAATSRPGLTFTSWLKGKLEYHPNPRRAWIVFDHLVAPKATKEVAEIAKELAESAALGEYRTLYVTLIDSDYMPQSRSFGGLPGPLYRDNPVISLAPADIANFMVRWAERTGEKLDAAVAAKEAQQIFEGLIQPLDGDLTRDLVQQRVARRLQALGLLS
jgi:hypothetical protein